MRSGLHFVFSVDVLVLGIKILYSWIASTCARAHSNELVFCLDIFMLCRQGCLAAYMYPVV